MKIRAAVLETIGVPWPYVDSRPLVIAELELEAPGPGELLVKINAAGLCHSDLSVIDGNRPRPVPMALGREASGVVAAVGVNVTRFHPVIMSCWFLCLAVGNANPVPRVGRRSANSGLPQMVKARCCQGRDGCARGVRSCIIT